MVTHDGHIGGTGFGPAKDDAPLVADPDGVEASEITTEGFQAVAGRDSEIGKPGGAVHLHQLPQSDAADGREAAVLFLAEKLPGVGVGKRLDHVAMEAIILLMGR